MSKINLCCILYMIFLQALKLIKTYNKEKNLYYIIGLYFIDIFINIFQM